MKKLRKLLIPLLAATLLIGLGFMAKGTSVQAATATYKHYYIDSSAQKIGKYYFKSAYSNGKYVVSMSSSKSSGYKATPLSTEFLSNGSTFYYVKDLRYLYRYTVSSKKNTKLKTLYSGGTVNQPLFQPTVVYDGKVYLTKKDIANWKQWTYVYNISKKTYKLAKSNCQIMAKIKNRALGQTEVRTDPSPYPISLYKFTSSGLTLVKSLSKYGWVLNTSGTYFYYADYPEVSYGGYRQKAVIYRLAYNSTKPKKLCTLKMSEEGYIYVEKVTSSYVLYKEYYKYLGSDYATWKYYYNTGKKVRVND